MSEDTKRSGGMKIRVGKAIYRVLACDRLGGCGHPAYEGDGGHSPSCPAYWRLPVLDGVLDAMRAGPDTGSEQK